MVTEKMNLTTTSSKSNRISKLCDFSAKDELIIKKKFIYYGDKILGKKYIVNEKNKGVITELLKYFTGNGELDKNKGIYLYGQYGTGKTIIFEVIRKLLADLFPFNPNGYKIASVETIVEHYKTEHNLVKFGYNINDIPLNLCINEFGKKMSEKVYGTDVNHVIESLFMIRYELFQSGKLTHVTSNIAPKDLEYPAIVKDRINEMFNFIEIKGESFR